jgi:hypothetical protein
MKVARTVLKERCPQVIEASTLIKTVARNVEVFTEKALSYFFDEVVRFPLLLKTNLMLQRFV